MNKQIQEVRIPKGVEYTISVHNDADNVVTQVTDVPRPQQ